jgi:hypothetical protein
MTPYEYMKALADICQELVELRMKPKTCACLLKPSPADNSLARGRSLHRGRCTD